MPVQLFLPVFHHAFLLPGSPCTAAAAVGAGSDPYMQRLRQRRDLRERVETAFEASSLISLRSRVAPRRSCVGSISLRRSLARRRGRSSVDHALITTGQRAERRPVMPWNSRGTWDLRQRDHADHDHLWSCLDKHGLPAASVKDDRFAGAAESEGYSALLAAFLGRRAAASASVAGCRARLSGSSLTGSSRRPYQTQRPPGSLLSSPRRVSERTFPHSLRRPPRPMAAARPTRPMIWA